MCKFTNQGCIVYTKQYGKRLIGFQATGSRSVFEFPSRVNLSGPNLYCNNNKGGSEKEPVPSSMDRTSRCNKVDAVRLYASYRLNLLLPKGQICMRLRSIFAIMFF